MTFSTEGGKLTISFERAELECLGKRSPGTDTITEAYTADFIAFDVPLHLYLSRSTMRLPITIEKPLMCAPVYGFPGGPIDPSKSGRGE